MNCVQLLMVTHYIQFIYSSTDTALKLIQVLSYSR